MQAVHPPARRLMAEMLWALMLFQSNLSAERKRESVTRVWRWSGADLSSDHPMLSDAVLVGIGSPGHAFNMRRWAELDYLIAIATHFKAQAKDDRQRLTSDAWEFAEWLERVPKGIAHQFRHILLHLCFPDQFERITVSRDKRTILEAFQDLSSEAVQQLSDIEVDRRLVELRKRLATERKTDEFDFYEADLQSRWRVNLTPEHGSSRAWLLSWNPANWAWTTLADDRLRTASGSPVHTNWRCANRDAKPGDTVYLMRTGGEPRGVIAHGTITKEPYQGPHYDPDRAAAGDTVQFVDVAFDGIRDPARDPFVPLEVLRQLIGNEQVWNPQRSGIEIKPEAASALTQRWNSLPAVAAEDKPLPAMTDQDFDVLAQHPDATPWDELTPDDRARFSALRAKLVEYGTALANRLVLRTKLIPFTSHPNPSGRNPLYQWCCVFPQKAVEKSYGFQLFLIIRPTHVEVGFASGTGTGGRKTEQKDLQRRLEEAKEKLLILRGSEVARVTFEAAARAGLRPRLKWLGSPSDPGLSSADEWLVHAASRAGNGAAVSAFLPREEVVALGTRLFDRLQSNVELFTPLIDAIYEPPDVGGKSATAAARKLSISVAGRADLVARTAP
jgi:hypothetical protein